MESPESDKTPATAEVIRDVVRAVRVGDVSLHDDQVGPRQAAIKRQIRLYVFVHDAGRVTIGVQVRGELGKAQGRKQRVFDRPPKRTGGLREGGQDEQHAKLARRSRMSALRNPFGR